MEIKDYLRELGITQEGTISEDDSYVIDLSSSDEYGKVYSRLERSDDLEILQDNQVVTEEGSSLIYESESQPYLLNLIADFDSNRYQLIINEIKED